MYRTSDAITITKDRVLAKVSECEIYARYLGSAPVIGKMYNSPLRKDSSPSFGLFQSKNGSIMFKDLGNGESGDCFKLASLIEGTTYRQTLTNIYNDNLQRKPRKIVEVPKVKVAAKKKDIVVDDVPFTPEGLLFWSEFGISQPTLDKFNVKQIKQFWVNGMEYWKATKASPMFSYFIYSSTKIYRPYYKKQRFYSACTSTDLQGWEQLDYSKDTVFITKSMKDIMLLHELGHTAISPHGENHEIPQKALNILRENFDNIIILYDRDMPGMLASQKFWRNNKDFDFMFTPRHTKKDLSDYYKEYGKQKTVDLINKKLDAYNILDE